MSISDVWYAIESVLIGSLDIVYDNVGNIFNYAAIAVIITGMVFWLRIQARLVKQEKDN